MLAKKNPIIRIFHLSEWLAVPINPDKWRYTVLVNPNTASKDNYQSAMLASPLIGRFSHSLIRIAVCRIFIGIQECIGEDLLIGSVGNDNKFISLHHVSFVSLLFLLPCGRHEENDLISHRLFKGFEKSHRDSFIPPVLHS
jgi:hypothetical protein